MTILHVETGRHWLGGPAQVLYIAAGQAKRGHNVCLLCPVGSAIAERAKAQGLSVREVRYAGDADPRLFFATAAAIRATNPDIVHLHSRRGADTQSALAARAMGRKTILSRRVDYPLRNSTLVRWRYRALYDHVIAISEAIRQVVIRGGVPETHVTTVYSSVDVHQFQPDAAAGAAARQALGVPHDAPLFGIVAHMIRRKGHDVLFRAVARLSAEHPEMLVALFGAGEEEDNLRALAGKLGIERHLLWLGFREDMPAVLPSIDCLVHPARLEGLGVAILQALACGKPVIACPVGGIVETVRPPEDGWLVPVDDDEALASAMREVLDDPTEAARRGEAGRALIEREFSVDAMVEGNLAVYRQVLNV